MFFDLKEVEDAGLKSSYRQIMSELNEFYGIDWVKNLPKIFFVDSRKQIDQLHGSTTERWVIGWIENSNVYVLKNDKMVEESSHNKYSSSEYIALLKHELSHCFFNILSDFPAWTPKWLWEGIATYISGQNLFKKKINEFKDFLSFYEQGSVEGVYKEAGFAVEVLVDSFGKHKLLSLVKNMKKYQSRELFDQAFKNEFGFLPNYDSFNSLLNDNK